MKYLLATILALGLAAAATGLVSYRVCCDPTLRAAATAGDAMEWLRTDFHLTDRQFAAIRQLHASYAGTCEEHCRLIQEATKARDALAATEGTAGAVAAERRLQDLRAACATALTGHVRQVAALMSPGEGRRYLALVLPKIAGFDHAAAPDLRLNHAP